MIRPGDLTLAVVAILILAVVALALGWWSDHKLLRAAGGRISQVEGQLVVVTSTLAKHKATLVDHGSKITLAQATANTAKIRADEALGRLDELDPALKKLQTRTASVSKSVSALAKQSRELDSLTARLVSRQVFAEVRSERLEKGYHGVVSTLAAARVVSSEEFKSLDELVPPPLPSLKVVEAPKPPAAPVEIVVNGSTDTGKIVEKKK